MAEFTLIKPAAKRGAELNTDVLAIVLDATDSESHEQSANITSWPVERAVNVTDNIQPNPLNLKLTGLITATPLNDDTAGPDRLRIKHQELLDAVASGEVFTVVTGLIAYESMAIRNYSADRNAALGQSISVTLDLLQIRVVEAAEIATPPYILAPKTTRVSGADEEKKGPQTGTDPDENEAEEAKSSMAYKLFGGLFKE